MFQDAISADQLDRAWRDRTGDLGQAAEVVVSCRAPAGHVVADFTIAFAGGEVAGWIAFEPPGLIAGLRILPPPEESPAPPG